MQRIYMTVFVLIASVVLGLAKAQDRVVDAPASNREVPKPFRFLIEGSIADLNAAWANLPFDRITLERTACLGTCPAYKVTLYRGAPKSGGNESFEDAFGRAELSVTRASEREQRVRIFPAAVGNFDGRVYISKFAKLSYLIQNSGLHLQDRYGAGWEDASTTIVSVSGPGISKTILENGGVGPIELWGHSGEHRLDGKVRRLEATVDVARGTSHISTTEREGAHTWPPYWALGIPL